MTRRRLRPAASGRRTARVARLWQPASRQHGIALVAALLTVAAIAALAVASYTLLRFDLALVRNQQQIVLNRGEVTRKLSLALLELELRSQDGVLPEALPGQALDVEYHRYSDRLGRLRVQGQTSADVGEVYFELLDGAGGSYGLRVVRWR